MLTLMPYFLVKSDDQAWVSGIGKVEYQTTSPSLFARATNSGVMVSAPFEEALMLTMIKSAAAKILNPM